MSFENKYRIELRDANGTLLTYVSNLVSKASWSWNRVGGCGECSLSVKTNFDGALAASFTEDSEVRIYLPNLAGTSELWYSGYIDKVNPSVSSDESISVSCLGYVNQLKRIVVKDKEYIGNECAEIVRNIAEVYATAYTSIVSAAANYESSRFTADYLYFNESAYDCISKIAHIIGKREWGVDANKNLFFKARNDSLKHFFNISQDFVSFQPVADYNSIVTRIYFEGKDGYKQNFQVTNKTSTREMIVSNSSIGTQQVAYQYARMYLKEKGMIRRSYTAKQVNRQTRIESTVPIGAATIFTKIGIREKYCDLDSYTKLCSNFDGADAATAYSDPIAGAYTFVGTAQLDTAQKKFGTASLLLDGDSDYVTLPDSADWNFGAGDFTIDGWIYLNAKDVAQVICAQYDGAAGTDEWTLMIEANNKLRLDFFDGGVDKGFYYNIGDALTTGTWYHIAAVRSGTSAYFFVNGVSQNIGTTQTAFGANDVGDVSSVLYVGQFGNSTTYFNGWIDELRISKGIARWTANFTPPTVAYGKERLYDSGIKYDGGNLALQIEKIKYDLTDSGVNASLSFGMIPPAISDDLGQLEYMISQSDNK